MAKFRTSLGKVVDMSALQAKYEKTRAVGNMSVNARGDTIDASGRVIKPVTAKVNENYARTVGNRAANVVRKEPRKGDDNGRPVNPKSAIPPRPNAAPPRAVSGEPIVEDPILTASERELEESLEDDLEIEQIKSKELGK